MAGRRGARPAILSARGSLGKAEFLELKDALGFAQGDLSVHARKLEDDGSLAVVKDFVGRMLRTTFKINPGGGRRSSAISVR
ncbi:MAG TPA: transcriptional regulator [Planctomycetota bacterium]|nr:transcriptional regulator [Planctomycetota bacterium]